MQAPCTTTTSPDAVTVNSTPINLLDTIQCLKRYEKDVDKETSLYFEDIMQRLKGPLLVSLRKSKKNYRPFAIRLLVLGTDETLAKPYIVVFCPACVSDLVRIYFRRETSRCLCQPGKAGPASFEVIVEGHPIRPTTSHHLHPTSVKTGHGISGRRRHRNTPLKIDGICGTRYATMGGYIVVVNKQNELSMYGLTAGHSIVQDDFEEEVESEQASEEPAAGRSLFPEIAPPPSQIPGSAMSRTMHNTTFDLATTSQEGIEWSGIATVAPASFSTQACDRDWALLAGIADQPGSGTQDGQTFERYLLGDPGTGKALIHDGMEISLQPPTIARLSRLPSFVLLPYGNDFVRVHTLTTPNAGRISAGTSGTWVSTKMIEPARSIGSQSATARTADDGATGNVTVFGQVVADDALGDAYVVPLRDILNDIKNVLDAQEARLPETSSEIDTILRTMNNTTIKIGGSSAATSPVVTASYAPSADAASSGASRTTVWFCSECGDGPTGAWQCACVTCGHQKCAACLVDVC